MSVKIEITIPDGEVDGTDTALRNRMALLGYAFGHQAVPVIGQYDVRPGPKHSMAELVEAQREVNAAQAYASHDIASRAAEAPVAAKEEPKPEPTKKARAKKAEPATTHSVTEGVVGTLNISAAPEHRVDPEVEAQDAADEAAEVATQTVKELTAEDLRAVMGQYVTAFGLAEAQADGPKLFADALGTPPAGSEMWSVTLASKNQDTLAKAIVAWNAAVEKGVRYGH